MGKEKVINGSKNDNVDCSDDDQDDSDDDDDEGEHDAVDKVMMLRGASIVCPHLRGWSG